MKNRIEKTWAETLCEYYNKIQDAKTLVEKYDIQSEAFTKLPEKYGDELYELLSATESYVTPKIVHMGLNSTKGDANWEDLKQKVREVVERDGICRASWSCEGRTRHQWQSEVLAEDMPEYDFDIGYNYKCEIRKKVS